MTAAPITPVHPAPGYLAVSGAEVVFLLLGLVVLGAAVLCVTSRSVVRSALWLVLSLGGLAGCYLVLTAELVAVVQVLIYAGAVVVLLLFGLMFTRAPIGRSADVDTPNRPVAAVVGVAAAGLLAWLLVDAFRLSYLELPAAPTGTAEAIGAAVFRHYVLPFEVISVLLLAALIGALVLSRPDISTAEHR
ncbi:MAG: NADH-quinone oxidoreductase subunit J [Actinobacteria bacterium]|nr:NADH-quinone oxidoreductase subunit J [Actinomycetota bacterium]MBI3686538.1 NADH-quinone oxidoreductase subunit J [Actinomycetota bacterium]